MDRPEPVVLQRYGRETAASYILHPSLASSVGHDVLDDRLAALCHRGRPVLCFSVKHIGNNCRVCTLSRSIFVDSASVKIQFYGLLNKLPCLVSCRDKFTFNLHSISPHAPSFPGTGAKGACLCSLPALAAVNTLRYCSIIRPGKRKESSDPKCLLYLVPYVHLATTVYFQQSQMS